MSYHVYVTHFYHNPLILFLGLRDVPMHNTIEGEITLEDLRTFCAGLLLLKLSMDVGIFLERNRSTHRSQIVIHIYSQGWEI